MDSPPQTLYHPRTPRAKSPLRRVLSGGITKVQKDHIIANLRVEIEERTRRMRSQYELQAAALRKRIEMRISRVPRKYWEKKMGDVVAAASGSVAIASWAIGTKRLSAGPGMMALGPVPGTTGGQQMVKKTSTEGVGRAGREPIQRAHSPQKTRPASPIKPSTTRPQLSPSKHLRPASPIKPTPNTPHLRSLSPIKRANAIKRPHTAPIFDPPSVGLSPSKHLNNSNNNSNSSGMGGTVKKPMTQSKTALQTVNKVKSTPTIRQNSVIPDRSGSLKENKVEGVAVVEGKGKGMVGVGEKGERGRVLRRRK